MPELPEVESVRRGLAPHIEGLRFTAVDVLHPRANRGKEGPLAQQLVGRTVHAVRRRGKFIWLELEPSDMWDDPGRDVVHIHLGMSGQLRIGHTDSKHTRIVAHLAAAERTLSPQCKHASLADAAPVTLTFIDQRTFGYWLLAPWNKIGHIAPDPLEEDFSTADAARRLRKKSSPIKMALLDQTIISGIGNIYADEALWAAAIDPRRPAKCLLQREAVALIDAARAVMEQALAVGGTSFDALYVNVNGESGYFARSLNAYGRGGEPCRRCGTPLEKSTLGGRGTHFCPGCQRNKAHKLESVSGMAASCREARAVGIAEASEELPL